MVGFLKKQVGFPQQSSKNFRACFEISQVRQELHLKIQTGISKYYAHAFKRHVLLNDSPAAFLCPCSGINDGRVSW
jgi:hypothetical protein